MKKLVVLFLSLFGRVVSYGNPPPPPPPCNTPQCSGGSYCFSNTNQCTICPPGYRYNANPNVGVSSTSLWGCTICPSGTFSSNAGSGGCTSCSPGTFSSNAGSTICSSCISGSTYADTTGKSSCLMCSSCPIGKYISSDCSPVANTICSTCPPIANCGTLTTCSTAANSQCSTCASGYYLTGSSNNICQTCTACSSGIQYETGPCSSSSNRQCSNCVNACPIGQMLAGTCAGTSNPSCITCPNGFYKTVADGSPCLPCITTCLAGYSINPICSNSINSVCLPCPSGFYKSTADGSSCIPCTSTCNAGYQLNQACTATVNPICIPCPNGFYKAVLDGSPCLPCTSACPAGFQLNQACTATVNPICIPCPIGFYKAATDSSPCLPCTSFCPAGFQLNQACASISNPICIPCPIGFYKIANDGSPCLECTANCGSGAYLTSVCSSTNNPGCAFCPANTANPNTNSTYLSSCLACPNGAVSAIGSATCLQCPLGTATFGGPNCTNCLPGTYADNLGTIECKFCPSGTANPLFKSTTINACIICPAGYYAAIGSAICLQCPIGTYDRELNNICLVCPTGTYNNITGQTTCASCPAGTANALVNQTSSNVCINCLPGSFSPSAGYANCLLCPAGTSSNAIGASNCLTNLPGTFTAVNGSTNVTKCPPGHYSDTYGASNCKACLAGSRNPFSGAINANNCTVCLGGTYMPFNGSSFCLTVAPGFYQDQSGQLAPIPCPAGTANNNTASATSLACLQCVPGKWQNQTGSSSCIVCPMGYYQPATGQTGCLACPSGTYNSFTGIATFEKACIACPVGTYSSTKAAIANTTCLVTPIGAYTNITGSANYTLCSSGTYQHQTNQTSCISCIAGTYNPLIGSVNNTSCIPSLPGFYVPFPGLDIFLPCKPGYVSNAKGNINCIACLPGTYNPYTSATACIPCPAGTFSLGSGFAQCQSVGIPLIQETVIKSFEIELTVNTNFTALLPFSYNCFGTCSIYINTNLITTTNNSITANNNNNTLLLNVLLGIDTISVIYNGTFTIENIKDWNCSNEINENNKICSIITSNNNNVITFATLIVDRNPLNDNIYADPNITYNTTTILYSNTNIQKSQTYHFIIPNLEAYVSYNFQIVFTLLAQTYQMQPMSLGSLTTLPAVPTGPVQNLVKYFLGINAFEHANNEQANLQVHWDPPAIVFQHGPIIGYTILYRQEERTFITYGPNVNVIVVPASNFSLFTNKTTFILTGLNPDTNYNITIFPMTDVVGGLGPGNSLELKTQVSAPPKPPILTVISRKATNITVTWSSLTNETGIITKAWIIAEPYSNKSSAEVVHIPRLNINLPFLPFPNEGIRGFFGPYNASNPCAEQINGFTFLSLISGEVCGGICDNKCEYGTPMLDPTTMLPTNDQNLTNDNYMMEFIDKDGNISSTRFVPYLTMKKRFVLNVSAGGLNLFGQFLIGDGKINPNSLLNNTVLDPNLAYRIRLIVFTSETLYAISDPLEIGPFQELQSPNILSAAAYIGVSIVVCLFILFLALFAFTKNRLKKREDIRLLKTGEFGGDSTSTDEDDSYYYEEIKNDKPPEYEEPPLPAPPVPALPVPAPPVPAPPLPALPVLLKYKTSMLFTPIEKNENDYFDVTATAAINNNNNTNTYFDVTSTAPPPNLPMKQKDKNKNINKIRNRDAYFEPSNYISVNNDNYIYSENLNEEENEDIFAIPSQIYNNNNNDANASISASNASISASNASISNPVYFSSYLSQQLNNNNNNVKYY